MEVWHGDVLVGGLYGIAMGPVFFGESMFSRAPDASKVALVRLVRAMAAGGSRLIDCQMHTGHLASLGARDIARSEFIGYLDQWLGDPVHGRRGGASSAPPPAWSFTTIGTSG